MHCYATLCVTSLYEQLPPVNKFLILNSFFMYDVISIPEPKKNRSLPQANHFCNHNLYYNVIRINRIDLNKLDQCIMLVRYFLICFLFKKETLACLLNKYFK